MLAHERSQQYAGPAWAGPEDEKHRCAVSPAVSFRFRCRADAGQQQRVIGGRSGSADWSNRAGETRAVGVYKRAPARRSPQPVLSASVAHSPSLFSSHVVIRNGGLVVQLWLDGHQVIPFEICIINYLFN